MHIELVDLLRCPAPHAESMLVLSARHWEGRRVMDGTLGCPVCRKEYEIRSGVADFAGASPVDSMRSLPAGADPDAVLRLAAQLDLREPGALVVLLGRYATLADGLSDLVQSRCIVVNAEGAEPGSEGGSLLMAETFPIARGKVQAAAMDPADIPLLAAAEPVLRQGGRVVAPASVPVPQGWDIVARDDREWVATSAGGSMLVGLARRTP